MKKEINKLQGMLTFFGSIAWLSLLSNTRYLLENWSDTIIDFSSGYVLGYIMVFFGAVFWKIVQGEIKKEELIPDEDNKLNKLHTIIVISIGLGMAFIIFIMNLFASLSWSYLLGVFISAVVVNQGVLKVIDILDDNRKKTIEKEVLSKQSKQLENVNTVKVSTNDDV